MKNRPRQLARELALLILGQESQGHSQRARSREDSTLPSLMLASVQALVNEAQDMLETAGSELSQGHHRLQESELKAITVQSARVMLEESIELSRKAINRISLALELPELIAMSDQKAVRDYALELSQQVIEARSHLEDRLNEVMVDWQLSRLPRVDQDILRIALAEMLFFNLPHQVAINEAVELAKRYSDDESRRLINGILRRVVKSGGGVS
jgi:N utilization substance protein B